MSRNGLEILLWAFIIALLGTTWIWNLINNHYKRGYRDGYNRGKAVARERHFD